MTLRFTTEIIEADWQAVLDNSLDSNVFHSIEYYNASQKDGNSLAYMGCYLDDKPIGVIVGTIINTGYNKGLIEVGSKSGGYPLIDSKYRELDVDEKFILEFKNKFLNRNKYIFYTPFREECYLANYKLNDRIDDWICVLDLTQETETLFKGMSKGCKSAVKLGHKNNLTCRIENSKNTLKSLFKYYKSLRIQQGLAYMSFKELEDRYDELTSCGLADIWVAYDNETPIAFAYIWKYHKRINFVYGSSDKEYLHLKPNNILQWELIKHYKSLGYLEYNMWGVVSTLSQSGDKTSNSEFKADGYGKFKLSFGGKLVNIKKYTS